MRIISLQAENIERLKAVSITFDQAESVHVIGGDNGAGKSSVLDAIMIALQQAGAHPPEPIRRGAKRSRVQLTLAGKLRLPNRLELDGLIIERKLARGRSPKLTVTTKDGAEQKRPQELLDQLCSKISFDPLAFLRLRGPEQKQQLRDMLPGIDWAALDREEARLFGERRDAAGLARRLRAQLDGMPTWDEPPGEPPDIGALLTEQRSIRDHNAKGEQLRARADRCATSKRQRAAEVDRIEGEIARLQRQLETAKGELSAASKKANELRQAADSYVDLPDQDIEQRIAMAYEQIQKHSRWQARHEQEQQTLAAEAEAEQLTTELEAVRRRRQEQLDAAELPVAGLSFDDDGVLLNGLPLSQASQTEQIRVSVAIAMKLNPKLPTALVRHGSLMRDASIEILRQEVAAAGGQCLLEHALAPDEQCAVVMVDGEAK